MNPKIKNEAIAFVLILISIIPFYGCDNGYLRKGDNLINITRAVPSWVIGDWWIIQTFIIEDISEIRHGPEKLGLISYSHLWEVVGREKINGKNTWVIDIKAINVPSEISNNHGTDYLWRLFLNSEDLTLVRIVMNIRSGRYLISGKELTNQKYDFMDGNPIVIDNIPVLTPIDIPKLPIGEFPRFLSEEEKELWFKDEESQQDIVQYIVDIEENINGKIMHVLYIKLYSLDIGIRIQKWVPGLPWWEEWHFETNERFTDGMLRAKLIQWGSKNSKRFK
jgi:hypothetical protein